MSHCEDSPQAVDTKKEAQQTPVKRVLPPRSPLQLLMDMQWYQRQLAIRRKQGAAR